MAAEMDGAGSQELAQFWKEIPKNKIMEHRCVTASQYGTGVFPRLDDDLLLLFIRRTHGLTSPLLTLLRCRLRCHCVSSSKPASDLLKESPVDTQSSRQLDLSSSVRRSFFSRFFSRSSCSKRGHVQKHVLI